MLISDVLPDSVLNSNTLSVPLEQGRHQPLQLLEAALALSISLAPGEKISSFKFALRLCVSCSVSHKLLSE